jgi:ABC-type sugar transport system permease subunit
MTSTSSDSLLQTPIIPNPKDSKTELLLRVLVVWHAILSLLALVGSFSLWQIESSLGSGIKLLLSVVLAGTALLSFAALISINRRNHRGRVLSLIVNYLGFLLCLFWGMHVLGIFTGIDSLAGTFGRGLPYLGIALVGYLIGAFGDRYETTNPANVRKFKQVGNIISLISGVMFLFALGIVPGFISLLAKFNALLPFLILLGVLVFGAMTLFMWRTPTARALHVKSKDQLMLDGYLFLSPNLLGFLFFFAGPLLFSLYSSFTDSDAFGQQNWIGLANYAEILHLNIARLDNPDQLAKEVLNIEVFDELARFNFFGNHYVVGAEDKLFWIALANTIKFVIFAVPLSIIPALLLATVLNSKLPGMKIYRALYFVPSIAAVVGVALIWRWLYNSTVGYINYAITTGVEFINSIAGSALLTDPKIGWLSDTNVALLAVAIIAGWQWIGFNTVLFLAGLQNIPKELYEAATVDGANNWAQFWKITLPVLAPTTFFVLTTTSINAMQIFDQVFVLTIPPGGPGTSTTTIVLYLYKQGFQNFRQGYASALAWVLFLLIFGLTLFQYTRQRDNS